MMASELLRQPVAEAIGWALVHFIWQGAIIGALTAAALVALRRSAADVRYVVATIALSLMLTMPAVTAVQTWHAANAGAGIARLTDARRPDLEVGRAASDPSSASVRVADDGRAAPIATSGYARTTDEISVRAATEAIADIARIEPWLPALLLAWMCGVGVLTLRLASGWIWVQRMKTHGTTPADGAWERMAARLSRRLHISRPIRLLASTMVDVPTVIGWLKPVVLLPASALAGLAPHQLEAILAHELAHVRRHDYFVNLLQTLVETLLFYHPAVWWLSRRIRTERENCCDDLAVSLCGDPYTYASALADLEGLRGARPLVMAATGGSLLQRVRRLLGAPASHSGRPPGWLAGSAAIVLMIVVAAGAVGPEALRGGQDRVAPHASTVRVDVRLDAPQIAPQATADVHSAPAVAPRTTVDSRDVRAAVEVIDAIRAATESIRATTLQLVQSGGPLARAVVPLVVHPATADHIVARLAAHNASIAIAHQSMAATATTAVKVVESTPAHATSQDRNRGNFTWSHNGDKLEVRYEGEIEFSDDDTDVRRLSPGGYLRIKDGGFLGGRAVEFRADASGAIQRRYWVGMSERPFEPEGRTWLAQALPRFIRQTGIGAQARVARILKSKGPAGVLAEISLIEGSWAKRVYFTHLFNSGTLDAATLRQALTQAGRDIDSDYELASLLINSAQRLLSDEGTRKAYFDAARTISYEKAQVLLTLASTHTITGSLRDAYIDAAENLGDYEQGRVLTALVKSERRR